MVFLGSFLVNLVPIMLGCCIQVGVGTDMVSPLVLVRVATISFLTPLLKFFGYPDGVVTELFAGTLKLRYSSTPFSMRFPSWTVSPHPVIPVPFSGPGSSVHFPDHDPMAAKRFRITGKSSVHKRELCSGDGLPTPKRWKRLVPPGTGHLGIKDDVPPFLFPRTGVG